MSAHALARVLVALLVGVATATATNADTLHVPSQYITIQEAIDAASDDDEVVVAPGTYNERISFLGKAITVRSSAGPEVTTLDGQHAGTVVMFDSGEGPDSVLDGFSVMHGRGASHWSGWVSGGGINCWEASPTIRNCVIAENDILGYWARASGGGVGLNYSSGQLVNCTIRDNLVTGTWVGGGGVFCHECPFVSIVDCLVVNNQGVWCGGIWCNRNSNVRVTNCTVVANTCTDGASGIYADWYCSLVVHNSIVWDNGLGAFESTLFVGYTDVGGDFGGVGNINTDPLFVDPLGGDYHLAAGSPCIDAGCNWVVPSDSADLDGDGRFFDDPNTPDTGCGFPPIVDMGAYEFGDTGPQPCFGDFNGDRIVDLSDLATLLANYGESGTCEGDLNCDGDVDLFDLSALLAVYGTTCE